MRWRVRLKAFGMEVVRRTKQSLRRVNIFYAREQISHSAGSLGVAFRTTKDTGFHAVIWVTFFSDDHKRETWGGVPCGYLDSTRNRVDIMIAF